MKIHTMKIQSTIGRLLSRNVVRQRVRNEYTTEIRDGRSMLLARTWRDVVADGAWLRAEIRQRDEPPPVTSTWPHQPTPAVLGPTTWQALGSLPVVGPAVDLAHTAYEHYRARKSETERVWSEKVLVLSGTETERARPCELHAVWLRLPEGLPPARTQFPFVAAAPPSLQPLSPLLSESEPLLDQILSKGMVHLTRDDNEILLRLPEDVGRKAMKRAPLRPEDVGHIAVSYAREDSDLVEELVGSLDGHLDGLGIQVWFDREIPIGSKWEEVLAKRFEGATAILVVMTPSSRQSEWVEREVKMALGKEVAIIPIAVDGYIDERFEAYQKVDFTGPSGRDWRSLLGTVEDRLRYTHTGLPPPSW
ncbi:MAG: toll/interleukin-1 receptor domain-containing protein [bacterium]|nr:toll/interleukin-1 receptor domain-containing protein [bacterium]